MERTKGFTLLEISIALTIIGLLVGSILLGKDMIELARLRSQITQIDKLNVAINTFRIKFGALPGDLSAGKAAIFNMEVRSGTPGHGDGDGYIGNASMSGTYTHALRDEPSLFWNDLGYSGLIESRFDSNIDGPIQFAAGDAKFYLPMAKIGSANTIFAFSDGNPSYPVGVPFRYAIGVITSTNAGGDFTSTIQHGTTPYQAFMIDSKMDDGIADRGIIWGMALSGYAYNSFSNGSCYSGAGVYSLSNTTTANKSNCVMLFSYK